MIRKTDFFLKRQVRVYERGYTASDKVYEYARREVWWLLFIIPLYIKETVIDKPK